MGIGILVNGTGSTSYLYASGGEGLGLFGDAEVVIDLFRCTKKGEGDSVGEEAPGIMITGGPADEVSVNHATGPSARIGVKSPSPPEVSS
jgi:hypothetical protein